MRIALAALLAVTLVACTDAAGVEADLSVIVEHPDIDTISYRMTCGEVSRVEGYDLEAGAACAALADPAVQSRLIDGPPAGQMCTEIYGGPDIATFTGTLAGETVQAQVDRANGCGIADWDELLADLLPPAIGVTE
jgi:hypothetical protein